MGIEDPFQILLFTVVEIEQFSDLLAPGHTVLIRAGTCNHNGSGYRTSGSVKKTSTPQVRKQSSHG